MTKQIAKQDEENLETRRAESEALTKHARQYLCGIESETAAAETMNQNQVRGGVGRIHELPLDQWSTTLPNLITTSVRRLRI